VKKALEAALLVGVLLIGGFIVRQWRLRRALETAHAVRLGPSEAPGVDMENPDGPPSLVAPPHSVDALPLIKQSRPAHPRPHSAVAVPAPAAPAQP
jgi:hypothetical protein